MAFNFEKLDVYKKAIEFTDAVYLHTKNFPKDEMFGLTGQSRRAAISIVLNVAEGSARSKKEFVRFLDIARGSTFECLALLQISLRQKFIDKKVFDDLQAVLTDISKMLSGLKKSLNR